jgi:hypothetical protein
MSPRGRISHVGKPAVAYDEEVEIDVPNQPHSDLGQEQYGRIFDKFNNAHRVNGSVDRITGMVPMKEVDEKADKLTNIVPMTKKVKSSLGITNDVPMMEAGGPLFSNVELTGLRQRQGLGHHPYQQRRGDANPDQSASLWHRDLWKFKRN